MTEITEPRHQKHRIAAGAKDTVIRLRSDHNVLPGQEITFVTEDGDSFATGYVLTVTTATVHDAPAVMDNLNCRHNVSTVQGLVRALDGRYEGSFAATTIVDIIRFRPTDIHPAE